MPTAKNAQLATLVGNALCTLIGEQVIHMLGRPPNFLDIQVRSLWGDQYRANVFVGLNAASATIDHSFFLTADGDGNIMASTPAIQRTF